MQKHSFTAASAELDSSEISGKSIEDINCCWKGLAVLINKEPVRMSRLFSVINYLLMIATLVKAKSLPATLQFQKSG
jgi:hypothetical protein